MDSDGVAIVSGGLDSVTLLYKLCYQDNKHPFVLSFDYGQRHVRELDSAAQICNLLGLEHFIIELHDLSVALQHSKSALTNDRIAVPEGHYSAENMKATVVPNRNMVMLSIATSFCIAMNGKYVATAVHAGDHAIYPDCRPAFLVATENAIKVGNDSFIDPSFEILAPFHLRTKTDIAKLALQLDVPINKTWSCYKGREIHCGRCGTCVERLEAVHTAGFTMDDDVQYEDDMFWRTQVANH